LLKYVGQSLPADVFRLQETNERIISPNHELRIANKHSTVITNNIRRVSSVRRRHGDIQSDVKRFNSRTRYIDIILLNIVINDGIILPNT
jgi:hypothetical protein